MDRTVDDAGQRSLAGQAADSVALKDLNRGPSPSMPMLVSALNQPIQDHGKDSSPPPLSPHFPFAQNPQIDDHTRPRYFPDPYPSGSKSAQYRFGYIGGDDGLANHGEGRRAGDWRSVTNGDEDGIICIRRTLGGKVMRPDCFTLGVIQVFLLIPLLRACHGRL